MLKSILQISPKFIGNVPNGILAAIGVGGLTASQGASSLDLSILPGQIEAIILAFTGLVTAVSALFLAVGIGGATQKLADKK